MTQYCSDAPLAAYSVAYDSAGARLVAAHNVTASGNVSLYDFSTKDAPSNCVRSADFESFPIAMATSPADGLTYIADSTTGAAFVILLPLAPLACEQAA